MSDDLGARQVWNSLVDRVDDPTARAIGQRFASAIKATKAAVTIQDDVLRRYLGSEYTAVITRTEKLDPEAASRIICDRVASRIAEGSLSSADVRAISDAIARLSELDEALGDAIDQLHVVFEEAVHYLREQSRR